MGHMSLNYQQKAVRKGNGQKLEQPQKSNQRQVRVQEHHKRHPLLSVKAALAVLASFNIRADPAPDNEYLIQDELTTLDKDKYQVYRTSALGVQKLAGALHYDDDGSSLGQELSA
jgi:hypothetical protein